MSSRSGPDTRRENSMPEGNGTTLLASPNPHVNGDDHHADGHAPHRVISGDDAGGVIDDIYLVPDGIVWWQRRRLTKAIVRSRMRTLHENDRTQAHQRR